MSNPYQTPAFDSRQFQDQPAGPASAYGPNWVGHVRVFAVLNAVQGVFEIMLGLLLAVVGSFMPVAARSKEFQEAQGQDVPPEQFFFVFGIICFVIGLLALGSGVLRIVAGFQNYRFKNRELGLISIVAGIVPVFTGYCAPTAIGMLVYGLIVHLDPAVVAAFKMAAAGKTPGQILEAYDPYQGAHHSPPQPSGPVPPPT